VVDFRDSWSNCLAFHFIEAPKTAWNTYPLIIVYNKENEIVCVNIKYHMHNLHKIFEYIQDNYTLKNTMNSECTLIPKDGSKWTYNKFVDLIDSCLERIEPPFKPTVKKERM
jgi:hypothetical protein